MKPIFNQIILAMTHSTKFFSNFFAFMLTLLMFSSCTKDDILPIEPHPVKTPAKDIFVMSEPVQSGVEAPSDSEECLKLIYPVGINMPSGITVHVYSDDEFRATLKEWYDNWDGIGEYPVFDYPIEILINDGSGLVVAVNSDQELIALYNEYCGDGGIDDDGTDQDDDGTDGGDGGIDHDGTGGICTTGHDGIN